MEGPPAGWGGGHWVGHSRRLVGLMGGVRILMRMWHQLISCGGTDYDIMSDTILDMWVGGQIK